MIQTKRDRRLAIDWCLKIRPKGRKPLRIGLTIDSLGPAECTYMFRIVFWLEPLVCLRIHHILRSDNDAHLHDHPWWFITFPLGTYNEWLDNPAHEKFVRVAAGQELGMLFRESRVPALREEAVGQALEFAQNAAETVGVTRFIINKVKGWRFHYRPAKYRHAVIVPKPTWTIVLTGTRMRDWGFWVKEQFVKWTTYDRLYGQTARPCSEPTETQA